MKATIAVVRHEQLWAPWRLAYVSGDVISPAVDARRRSAGAAAGADPDCFICRAVAQRHDRANLLVERTALSVVILNRFPYNNGHLLVAPLRHQGRLAELSDRGTTRSPAIDHQYTGSIETLMDAEGFNIGLNLGRVAGAGLPGHLHWHLVPRWQGDTNFMPAWPGFA